MDIPIVKKGKRTYKKKKQWNSNEEALLITLWGDHIGELRGCRKNSHIFEEMVEGMKNSGFDFTPEELRVKIHNFTNKYRDEKRRVGPSGGSPSSWPFYERVHTILGAFKSNSIEMIMDESTEPSCSTNFDETVVDFEVEALLDESDDLLYEPPPKKSRKTNFNNEILKKIQESTDVIEKEIHNTREVDNKILKLQEDMVEIERERNIILKQLLNKLV